MPKQLKTNAQLQVTDLTAQDLKGSTVKIEEANTSSTCKAKKRK